MDEELTKALKDPGVAQKLTAQGIDIDGGGPEALDKFVRGEMARWAKVVKENNIRAGDYTQSHQADDRVARAHSFA